MAPVKKTKKLSSSDHRPISATDANQQKKPLGSFVTFGKRRSLRVAMKTKSRRWVCNDIWMDMFPFLDRPQLGLKLALLSPRFEVLVDKHFDGKSELPIWEPIRIERMGTEAKLCVVKLSNGKFVSFPLPDHPLHNKIRFENLWIKYIDYSVVTFLRANKQIFDKYTNLSLHVPSPYKAKNIHKIWNVFARKIWPIFTPNIRHLNFTNVVNLENLLRYTSSTILTDLNIKSINSNHLFPDSIADDGPNATAGQALSKWLNTPTKNGQTKQLSCCGSASRTNKFVNNFKEAFLHATTSSTNYIIQIKPSPFFESLSFAPFELMNERTNEMLTLEKEKADENVVKAYYNGGEERWIMKRCQIGQTATIKWEDKKTNNLSIGFTLYEFGRLSPPKADKKNAKRPLKMSAGPSGQRKKK